MSRREKYYKLAEIHELSTIDNPRLNGVPRTDKEKEAMKWIVRYYNDFLTRIVGTSKVMFKFVREGATELVIAENNNEIQKMLWVSSSPLEIVATIAGRIPLRVDMRTVDISEESKDNIKVYLLESEAVVMINNYSEYRLQPFDRIRSDERDVYLDRKDTAELYYEISRIERYKKIEKKEQDRKEKKNIDSDKEMEKEIELVWGVDKDEFLKNLSQKRNK